MDNWGFSSDENDDEDQFLNHGYESDDEAGDIFCWESSEDRDREEKSLDPYR